MMAHPFFMKASPSDSDDPAAETDSNPLLSALQQIKYSPEDNSPQELALSHKTDGLFHFKLKKYRTASLAFTEGLKYATQTTEDKELEANLYNNRGVCQFHLENYASALDDFKKASASKHNYCKSQRKAVECCLKLSKWEQGQDLLKELKKDCKTPECSAHGGIAELERQLKIGKVCGVYLLSCNY
jgi:tetratricopeptide (TPR) repeat protein